MPLQHKLFHVSSRDRDLAGSSSTSDFSINVNNLDKLQQTKAIVLKTASIPNVMYNINNTNRSFTYNVAGSPTTVQVAAGQYSLTEFITAFQIALTGVGMAVTQNAITKKLDFTTSSEIEYLTIAQNNAMADVLGIGIGSAGADVSAFSPSGLPQLQGIEHIHIRSNTLSEGSNMLSTNRRAHSTLGVVPVTEPFGGVIHYQTSHAEIDDIDYASMHGRSIQSIDIKLTDHNGNVLDLQNNHCSLIFKVYY